jgi:RHS repeat-associated protein
MNKTTISGYPGSSFVPTYNTSNHYATLPSGTPSYDSNGNLLNDSFHTYTWDNEGNPVTVDGNPLTYDALDRRVEYYSSSLGYVQYLWAPYDATRNLVIVAPAGPQYELPLPGGSQAILGSSGITEYRRPNWQGSQVIDSTTSQTATIDASFSPYGERYAENGYLGFFGGNLSIYPFFMDGYAATWRLYHYDQNRWISPDPAGLSAVDPSDPQTWNRYAYARGNPLGTTDPSGLCSDYDPSCADFSVTVHACPNWWNIWCWATGGNGTSPLPPSQYQAFNAGVNPNSGNPGAPGFTGQVGGSGPNNVCSESGPQIVRDASVNALSRLNPGQDESNNTTTRDGNFANVVNPALINTNTWNNAATLHGTSLQSPTIPGQNIFVVKLYNDPNRGNIIAVVYPNGNAGHMRGIFPFLAGSTSRLI